jgi:Na+/H+ antiporter NhaD/arsenite permease-like protein
MKKPLQNTNKTIFFVSKRLSSNHKKKITVFIADSGNGLRAMVAISTIEILVGIVLLVTLLLIITERVHKTLVAMLGATVALFFAIFPGTSDNGGALVPDVEHLFELIEMDLILVIIGITLMVGVARTTGLFDYISLVVLKKTGDNQYKLIISLAFLTMVFSAVLDAYMAILIVGSITIVSCQALDINPKPYIIAEAIYGDLGGTLTRIASPPNLIIGGHYDIDFVTFFLLTAPYVIVASILTVFLMLLVFRKDLRIPISKYQYQQIMLIDEKTVISDMKGFKVATVILVLTILAFAVTSFLPIELELGYIAIAGGFTMLAFVGTDVEKSLEKIEWPLVFFLVGLLLLVSLAEKTGLLELLAAPVEVLFSLDLLGGVIALQWINALASAVLDNVPVASIMTGVMDQLIKDYPNLPFYPLMVSVVMGTNLGGNITPIGSASTVQALEILKRSDRKDAKIGFLGFVKIGGFITFFQLICGSVYLIVLWNLF